MQVHAGQSGLNRRDGPAITWADGVEEFFQNAIRLPRAPALGAWTIEEIHRTTNSESRRVMIESVGSFDARWREDPVAAAAWQYGVPVETYRTLQRRT